MKREIQKRKKGFWALCLAILLAWMQLAPQVVYAANYTVYTDGNTSFDITGVTELQPGDVITYDHGSAYAGDSVIEYYDEDGTTRIDWESNTTSGIVTGARFSVKTYTGTQIESGLFKAWEKKSITGTSGYVSKIILQAVEYPKSNITYVINDVEYTSSLNPSFYYEGKGLASLQAESKEGYTFDGWYSNAECTTKVTSIPDTQIGDITLYAKFTGDTYNITYELGEGVTNDPLNPTTYTCGVGVLSFYDAVKPGHDFQYWCVEKGDALEQISSIPVDYYGAVTLKPSFTPATYNINYVLDGGANGAGNPATYTYGTGVPILSDATKEGYTFGGWYSDAECTAGNEVKKISATQTGNMTLYAKFTANKYGINYHNLDGAENGAGNPPNYTYGDDSISLADAKKTGYQFEGWYKDSKFEESTKVTSISTKQVGPIDLYAKFTIIPYQITYDLDGGSNGAGNPSSYTYGTGVPNLADASKEGYTFDGWYSENTFTNKVSSIAANETGDKTLWARFLKNYTITYELNGGTVVAGPNPNYYVAGRGITSFADATKTGYTFGGWYSDAACTAGNEVTEISATKTGDMILYAKFIVNDFQITYELDGGTNGAGNPTGYVYGLGVSSLADATKEGYTFDGWFTDASFTVPVTSISASRTGDVKLYAKFTKIVILSDGKGSITVSNTNYGETINPICVSETNGTENVSVTYKMKGADDATYTETVPVKPGDYTARAIFAKTDAYKQVTATCDFSIAYLTTPANPYAISGTKGKNNYYTTNVTITPAAGYLIADALDGTYQEKLEFSKTTDAFSVYLKKTDTGAKTAGIKVAEIKIDKSAPVISGAKNGQTIYGDEGKIVVKDANLSRVTVNGKKILIAEKSLEIPLSSQRGEEKYVIIAHDLAGNKKKLTVTVAAEWTKKKSIPSGEKVKLYKNRSYSFGTKTFKVSNDDTTYAANTTFYVGSDGDYVFSETN